MKKIVTLFAASILFAGVAFADSVALPTVTFSTDDGTEEVIDGEKALKLNSISATVDIQFSSNPSPEGAELMVFYAPGTADFTADMIQVTQVPVGNVLSLDLTKEDWGQPYMGEYHLTLMVTWMDVATGDFFYNEDDELIAYQMPCVTPNVFPAEFQYVYPDNNWEDETFTEAYENGVITFGFTNPVTFSNEANVATITYVYEGDPCDETVTKSECSLEWNRLDGFYTVSFNYANEDYPIEGISQITITLNGTIYVPKEEGATPVSVEVPSVELTKPVTNPAPRKQKSRMTEGLTSNDEIVNVYNIQGMLVKESINKSAINELPAGLYIVDGKKVVVR